MAVSRGPVRTVSLAQLCPTLALGEQHFCPGPGGCLASSASGSLSLSSRAWSQELLSSEELARDVVGAQQLLEQHEELDQEIQECCRQAQSAWQEGQQLLDDSLFVSPEV